MWLGIADKVFKVEESKVKVIYVQMCECYNVGRTVWRALKFSFFDAVC